jgi:hypothetical protein
MQFRYHMKNKRDIEAFFLEIYNLLYEIDRNVIEAWFEISKISYFKDYSETQICCFLDDIESVSIQKGNYMNYIAVNKILFIVEAINILSFDIQTIANLLDYNAFEALIGEIMIRNNYSIKKNFRFSDKSNFKSMTKQKRYEIDIIGVHDKFLLLIDAKQWKKKDSYSAMNKAANLQYRRAIALQKNIEIVSNLMHDLCGFNINLKKRLPLTIIPIMVSLEDNHIEVNENLIPLVSIYKLNAFLQELRINHSYFKQLEVKRLIIQKQII